MLDYILKHFNPLPIFSVFLHILFNVFLPSVPQSPIYSFPLRFPEQNLIYISHFLPCVVKFQPITYIT